MSQMNRQLKGKFMDTAKDVDAHIVVIPKMHMHCERDGNSNV